MARGQNSIQTWLGLSIVSLAMAPAPLWSSGATGSAVLNTPVGARAIGMGEAYTAMADDASSLYWNPAGLAFMNQSQASFMYNPYFNDLTYHNASLGVPVENGGLGASLSYLSYGQIDAFDANGDPAGSVNAYSGVATFGGAWLGNNWSAGVNLKGVQQKLAEVKATGIAGDAGASVVFPKEVLGGTLRAAFALRNVGSGLKFIDQTDPFPREWRIGVAAVQMARRRLNVSLDYGQRRDEDGAIYLGSEYWALPYIALRAGYAGNDSEGNGIRAGLGLKFKGLAFDYAFSNHGDLGFSHRYELSVRFGSVHPRLTHEEKELMKRAKLALAQRRYGEATQLFDAVIQVQPSYKPARRLVKVAMAGYEGSEKAESAPYSAALRPSQTIRQEEIEDMKDLENLLRIGEENVARDSKPTRRTEEKPQ